MENASKALIIAGAILISILLISVGILIMNSTGDITDQVGSQAKGMAIQTFNGQFTPYEGSGKSASQVKALVNAVNASNSANSHTVGVTFGRNQSGGIVYDENNYAVNFLSELPSKWKYTISLRYADESYVIPNNGRPAGVGICVTFVKGEDEIKDVVTGQVIWCLISVDRWSWRIK